MKKLWYILLVLLPLAGLLVASCAAPASSPATTAPSSTGQPQYGGRLRYMIGAGPGSPIGWPPEVVGPSGVYNRPTMESFLFEDPNGVLKPWLATDWKIAPDLKSITFTLRKDVKFQDGTAFNAQAVKFNLEASKSVQKSGTEVWSSIDVIDDYTVRLNVSKFQNTILNNLAEGLGAMISPTAYQSKGIDWVRWNPVSTGSFKFISYTQDVSLKYDRYESYWQKGKPYLDGIDYVIVKDSSTQLASFQRGEADILNIGPPKTAADLKAAGYQMIYIPTNTVCLIPDTKNTDSPFADIRVRQAVEYAINKEEMVKALGYGFWIPKYQYAVPAQTAFIKDLPDRQYNVNKAKQLLSDAGYPTGFKTTIYPDPQSSNADSVTAVQAYLKEVGIDVTVENAATAKYNDYRTKGWKNGLMCQAIGVYTPNVAAGMASVLSTSAFASLKQSPNYLAALDEALTATDADKQVAATQKAGRAIYEDEMIIPLYSGMSCYALQKWVHDTGLLSTSQFTMWAYYNAWLDKSK
jgi:peptide/nickel transport system substrate-binding protein